jgi:CheY-like chemotaxis protein
MDRRCPYFCSGTLLHGSSRAGDYWDISRMTSQYFASSRMQASSVGSDNMKPKHFLVIGEQHGSVGLREVLYSGLQREGFNVDCAASQCEALQVVQQVGAPDVIFVDDMLPGLDRRQFRQQLHEVAPNARILLINGGTTSRTRATQSCT